jgi:hypothetical protein
MRQLELGCNSRLPVDARIRVFGGDPGPGDQRSRETTAVSVLKEQVLQKHGKALVICGAAYFFTTEEFIGGQVLSCRGGCKSVWQGSSITLGQVADAGVYVGGAK